MDRSETHTSGAVTDGKMDRGNSGARSKEQLDTAARIAQLEFENSRLQQLVAELLIKNHQLRKPAPPEL